MQSNRRMKFPSTKLQDKLQGGFVKRENDSRKASYCFKYALSLPVYSKLFHLIK